MKIHLVLLSCLLLGAVACETKNASVDKPSAGGVQMSAPDPDPISPDATIIASGPPNKYVMPHVDAIITRVDWAQLEPQYGAFEWRALDNTVASYAQSGKKTVVIGQLVSDAVVNGQPNTATPAWALAGVGITKCTLAPKGVPILWSGEYQARAEAFIVALLRHFDGNANVLYVRVGYFEGGENCPLCAHSTTGYSQARVMQSVQEMTDYIHSSHPVGTRFVNNCNGCQGDSYADQEGMIFAADGVGIGMQSVSAEDKTSFQQGKPCTGDWCAIFKAHAGSYLYLQPAVNQPLGSLPIYVPFARTFGTDAFELFNSDMDIAYDPTNPNYAKWGASYRAAIGQ